MRTRPHLLVLLALALGGCIGKLPAAPADAGDAAPLTGEPLSRLRQLLEIENRRTDGVTQEDITSRDLAIRRSAARALARIGSPNQVPWLQKTLADDDPLVVSWSAYGLGFACRLEGVPTGDIVRALVARAVTVPRGAAALDAEFALARALGHCATDEAERTLVAWLEGPRPRAGFAALGLGDIASRRKMLAEPTQLGLLTAAAGSAATTALVEGLYPFGRLDHPLPTVEDRLAEVARARLADAGQGRMFAIRALARAGKGAAPELGKVLAAAAGFTSAERVEAARGLERMGAPGQAALAAALPGLVPAKDAISLTALGTAVFGPLAVALESLHGAPQRELRSLLYELANLAFPPQVPELLSRRIARIRCDAALALVNAAADDPLIVRCDPDPQGAIGQRALVTVLGRRPIRAKRLATWRKLVASENVRIREAALELLAGHPEIEDVVAETARALGANQPGVVATAAQIVAAHPDSFTGPAPPGAGGRAQPAPAIAQTLGDALDRTWAPDDVETVGALLEAAGALGLASAQSRLESFCRHANPTLRDHAARGLSLLRGNKASCLAGAAPDAPATELTHLAAHPRKVELATDVGPLELAIDPSLAPVAATRILDLFGQGFYTGIAVHRVLPGFVAQLGDPWGDGFGGPGREPLRCETSPVAFEPFDIGIALAGRDTGSSQIFVTLARHPHLDSEYAVVGKASGPWDALDEGDTIRQVEIVP